MGRFTSSAWETYAQPKPKKRRRANQDVEHMNTT